MATTAPSDSMESLKLCDHCHQRPKFGNHPYCSKTCAGYAVALCKHCHKKPKFQGFDYCGKTCAALANPRGKGGNSGVYAPQYGGSNQAGNTKGSFDPIQIAKLVAQHIPQIQAIFRPTPPATLAPPPQCYTIPDPFADPVGTQTQTTSPSNNPFLQTAPAHNAYHPDPAQAGTDASSQQTLGPAMTNGAVYLASSGPLTDAQPLHRSTRNPEPADNLECLIYGCGEPVQRDAQGVKVNDYCSARHAEEAVTSGYALPCILCLTMPQSDDDYFCSETCRRHSLDKHA